MAGETIITVVGNLTDDPELKFTPSGAAVANFTVASTPRTFDRQTNEWKDGDALFIRCAAWRQLAENVAESLQKGQRVIVTGALSIRNYERQDGSKGTSVEINVESRPLAALRDGQGHQGQPLRRWRLRWRPGRGGNAPVGGGARRRAAWSTQPHRVGLTPGAATPARPTSPPSNHHHIKFKEKHG